MRGASSSARSAGQSKPSLWIWLPYIWLFICSTRGLSIWLGLIGLGGDVGDADLSGSPADRALMTLLMLGGLVILGLRGKQTAEILRRNKWLVVLFVYSTLSIVWSNFPGISVRRVFRSMGAFEMVLVVLTENNPLEGVRALLRRLYLVHIPLSIITIKYFRSIGVAYSWNGTSEMWVGLTRHKNNLGQVSMCSGLFSSWQVLQNWTKKLVSLDLVLFILTMWLLRGSESSHSSTAIVGFIVCVVVLFGLQFIKGRAAQAKRIILWGTIALILLAPFVYMGFEAFNTTPTAMVLAATGRDMTLSDRTYLWTDILNNAKKSPIVGVGFGAFWVGPVGYAMYPLPNWGLVTKTWRPGEGHNGYIDVYVQLGVVGMVLLVLVIGSAIAGALDTFHDQFELGRLRLALLLSVLINNVAETSFLDGTHSLWFIFLLAAVNIPTAPQRDKFVRAVRVRAVRRPDPSPAAAVARDYAGSPGRRG
jgi:exopolysaccharide production protein ExoQ